MDLITRQTVMRDKLQWFAAWANHTGDALCPLVKPKLTYPEAAAAAQRLLDREFTEAEFTELVKWSGFDLHCDECDREVNALVRLVASAISDETGNAEICLDCLKQAVALIANRPRRTVSQLQADGVLNGLDEDDAPRPTQARVYLDELRALRERLDAARLSAIDPTRVVLITEKRLLHIEDEPGPESYFDLAVIEPFTPRGTQHRQYRLKVLANSLTVAADELELGDLLILPEGPDPRGLLRMLRNADVGPQTASDRIAAVCPPGAERSVVRFRE